MGNSEPPSAEPRTSSSLFFIGKDSRGNWIVQDQSGRCGGLFISRKEALKFALFENGNRPQAVVMVAGGLELNMSGSPFAVAVAPTPAGGDAILERQAA